MKPATALVLLGAALLLIPGRNGELCSAVKKDVDLFLNGTTDEYVTYMKKYISDPEMLAIAASVKECVDDKLTEEDKENASSVLGPCVQEFPNCPDKVLLWYNILNIRPWGPWRFWAKV
ncbi:Major allergen I polypeptide chain 1 [Heterocephalus glaber]|uniref:Major allergen I polypeptide chain 1 n=1 Tax=Heterocephalus glaber TaxID=10181 RepID=G5BXL3_HETGA|nr:Major allergen I polypeptide chain 1 [Heterocephalus glaber]